MNKTEAFEIVFDELKKIGLFQGKYDAKNGNPHYMHGVSSVMEAIAYRISNDVGDDFSDLFVQNLIESEDKIK